jgi:hypothetical protein
LLLEQLLQNSAHVLLQPPALLKNLGCQLNSDGALSSNTNRWHFVSNHRTVQMFAAMQQHMAGLPLGGMWHHKLVPEQRVHDDSRQHRNFVCRHRLADKHKGVAQPSSQQI